MTDECTDANSAPDLIVVQPDWYNLQPATYYIKGHCRNHRDVHSQQGWQLFPYLKDNLVLYYLYITIIKNKNLNVFNLYQRGSKESLIILYNSKYRLFLNISKHKF